MLTKPASAGSGRTPAPAFLSEAQLPEENGEQEPERHGVDEGGNLLRAFGAAAGSQHAAAH